MQALRNVVCGFSFLLFLLSSVSKVEGQCELARLTPLNDVFNIVVFDERYADCAQCRLSAFVQLSSGKVEDTFFYDRQPWELCIDVGHVALNNYNCPEAVCTTDRSCLPRSKICDGVADCPAGEDEFSCADIPSVETTCEVSGGSKGRVAGCKRAQIKVSDGSRVVAWILESETEDAETFSFFDGDESGERIEPLYSNGWISAIAADREVTVVGGSSATIFYEAVPKSGLNAFVHGIPRISSHDSIEAVIPGSRACGSPQNPCPSIKSSMLANCETRTSNAYTESLYVLGIDAAISFVADAPKVTRRGREYSSIAWLQCTSLNIVMLPGVITERRLPVLVLTDSVIGIRGLGHAPLYTIVDYRMVGGTIFEYCLLSSLHFDGFTVMNTKRITGVERFAGEPPPLYPMFIHRSRSAFNMAFSALTITNFIFDIGESGGEVFFLVLVPLTGANAHTSPVIPAFTAFKCMLIFDNREATVYATGLPLFSFRFHTASSVPADAIAIRFDHVFTHGHVQASGDFIEVSAFGKGLGVDTTIETSLRADVVIRSLHFSGLYLGGAILKVTHESTRVDLSDITIADSELNSILNLQILNIPIGADVLFCDNVQVTSDDAVRQYSISDIVIRDTVFSDETAFVFPSKTASCYEKQTHVQLFVRDAKFSCTNTIVKVGQNNKIGFMNTTFLGCNAMRQVDYLLSVSNAAGMTIQNATFDSVRGPVSLAGYDKSQLVLEGVTITHCASEDGILLLRGQNAVLSMNAVTVDRSGDSNSLVISLVFSRLEGSSLTFRDNRARAGGVFNAIQARIEISNSSFVQNFGNRGGVVFAEESEIIFDYTNLERNSALDGGVAELSKASTFACLHCDILSNSAQDSGGVYILRGMSEITTTGQIRNNTALLGAVLYLPEEVPLEHVKIVNALITNNTATAGGGIAFAESWGAQALIALRDLLQGDEKLTNDAPYGPTVATPPRSLIIDLGGRHVQVASNPFFPVPGVKLMDELLQTISAPYFATRAVVAVQENGRDTPAEDVAQGPIAGLRDSGVALFPELNIAARPYTNHTLTASVYVAALDATFSDSTAVELRQCVAGEILSNQDESGDFLGCTECPEGTYSLAFKPLDSTISSDPEDTTLCRPCPAAADCFGNQVKAISVNSQNAAAKASFGSWHRTPSSTLMRVCPEDAPCAWDDDQVLTCTTGRNVTNADGETDNPVCSLCEPGYGTDGRKCAPCGGDTDYIIVALVFLAFTALVLYFSEKYKVFTEERLDRGIIMKIAMSYLHVLAAGARLKDRFQGVLYDWLDVETKAGQSVSSFDVAYFDCASKAGGMAYHTQLYIKFALPFIFAIYFFVVVGIIFAIKRGDSKQASRNKEFRLAVVRTTLVSFNLLYAWTSELAFSTLASVQLDQMEMYFNPEERPAYPLLQENFKGVASNFSIDYNSISHSSAIIVASIVCVVLVVGFPVGIVYLLTKQRTKLHEADTQKSLGFVFLGTLRLVFPALLLSPQAIVTDSRKLLGYRDSCYYWEAVIIARKATTALIIAMFSTSEEQHEYQVGFTTLVAVLAFTAQTFFMPFKKASHNILELLSVGSFCATMFASIMYLTGAILERLTLEAVTAGIVISVHLIFICSAAYALFAAYLRMAMETKLFKKMFRV